MAVAGGGAAAKPLRRVARVHDPAAVQPRVAWIGLGSNLERPERQVRGAVEAIVGVAEERAARRGTHDEEQQKQGKGAHGGRG